MTNTDTTPVVRVIPAFGTAEIAEAVQRAAEAAAVNQCLVVAGIVRLVNRRPRSHSAWRFSLSHWGQPPVVVSTHRLRPYAEAQMARVRHARDERDLRDDATFAALIQELAAFGDGAME